MPLAYTVGTYLLQTKWNQTYPYNKFLPSVGDQTVVAGCVNVALAQVMRYYGYPASSKGVISYTWTPPAPQLPEVLKTILYRSYNWTNMPDSVDATTPQYQADEVALLLKDLGIANRTAFDAGGSSTSLNTRILLENFGYSTGLSERGNGPDQAAFYAFLTTLEEEIVAERPVLFTFPGHMTVADGYRTDDTGESVHINMGWGGPADDFYFLDRQVEAGGHTFTTGAGDLNIYFKIKPCSTAAGDCAVNLEAGDGIDGLAITGNFNQGTDTDIYKDTDIYEVYLKGPTTLRATRGYSYVDFFVYMISAADGSEAFALLDPFNAQSDTTFNVGSQAGGLPSGKYIVRISLCNAEVTSCFQRGLDHYTYTVTLTSGTLTAEEKAAIDRGLDKPPVIGNAFPDLILNTASGSRKILIDARDENGDAVTLKASNSNPAAVGAVLNGNILELTPGAAKVSSRIVVTATANGKTTEKHFIVFTDSGDTAFGKSFVVGGIFTGQSDVKTHQAILEGNCTITGNRPGYSNQAFFSSVLDASENVVASADGFNSNEINTNFTSGIYRLRAAICMTSVGCYSYTAGDTYTFTVNCPNAVESITTIAGILGIDLAGAIPPGDLNADFTVTLADAILVMQMLSGMDMTGKTIVLQADANGDHRIGLAEVIFILQKAAGLRSP